MAVGWWELVKKKMGPGPGNHRSAPSCKFGMYCKVVDRMVDKSGISRYVAMASHIYIVNYIGLSLLYTLLITLAYHISKVWQCVRSPNFDRYTDIEISNQQRDNERQRGSIHTLIHRSQLCFLVVPERLIPNIHGIWMGYWWDIMFVHISLMKSCCSFTTIPHHAQIMPKYMKKYQKFETIFGMVV